MSRPDELVTLLRLRFNGRFDELIELPDKFKALYTKQRKTKSD